jgi:hypothetical protein
MNYFISALGVLLLMIFSPHTVGLSICNKKMFTYDGLDRLPACFEDFFSFQSVVMWDRRLKFDRKDVKLLEVIHQLDLKKVSVNAHWFEFLCDETSFCSLG